MGSINSISGTSLQSILAALQKTGSTSGNTVNVASTALQADSNQLSPFAQLMSSLQ
jgi:hypothetical protein